MNSSLTQAQTQPIFSTSQTDGWPGETLPMFERAITTEYASLTQRGAPLTYPVTPYIGETRQTLDVSTGLTYPSKAERARRNPKVALLFSDPVGTGLSKPPVVLVQGLGAVRDADLQANTDRYLRQSMQKVPEAYAGMPRFLLRQMPWYFVRIWIQVTPLRMLWWPEGNLDRQPEVWQAPENTLALASDPAAQGKAPGSWKAGPPDWRIGASYAVEHLGDPVVTLVDDRGYPLPMRVQKTRLTEAGFQFELPAGLPANLSGSACLTFHSHPEKFTGQQNMVFTGEVERNGEFIVEKQIGDWSMTGSKLRATWEFMSNGRKLSPRLAAEAARRGQPVPEIRFS